MLKRRITLRHLWFLAGFVGIEILLVLSFILVPRFTAFANEDMLLHFAAYCVLCLWFLLPCRTSVERWQIVGIFLVLALGTEVLQPLLSPYHIFDWRDVVANVLGVIVAMWFSGLSCFRGLAMSLGRG